MYFVIAPLPVLILALILSRQGVMEALWMIFVYAALGALIVYGVVLTIPPSWWTAR